MKCTKRNKYAVVILVILLSPCIMATSPNNWTFVNTDSGVTLYERWVYVNTKVTVKERRGEMTVNGKLDDVVSVLSDPSKTGLWMNKVSSAYLIRKESDKAWYSYTYFSLPWPFENRDMICYSNLKYNQDGSTASIEMISKDNIIPVKPKAKRLTNYKAIWELREIGNNRTVVIFSAVSFNPPEYPRMIQDRVMTSTLMDNLQNLKELIEH